VEAGTKRKAANDGEEQKKKKVCFLLSMRALIRFGMYAEFACRKSQPASFSSRCILLSGRSHSLRCSSKLLLTQRPSLIFPKRSSVALISTY
jgi:hypothetical protein